MFRKLLSLAALAAAFTLILGTTDAQARHCRSQCRNYGCNQSCNYRQNNCRIRQTVNTTCQQASRCAPRSTCCAPQATCCVAQTGQAIFSAPASNAAPQPAPFVEEAAPAPPAAPTPGS
jgi:hypothetical protein